jgi:diguanylate cyclase (GGDEF)-like protein/PAS domain S-box-containing protein
MADTSSSFEASTLAALGQAVVVSDLERRILYWNKAAEEMFGWAAAEVLGRDVVEIARAEEETERDATVMARIARGEKVIADYWMVRRDGTRFPTLATITPVLQHGNLVAVATVATDMTERRQAEEATRRLSWVVESSLDAIVATDLEGRITSWNEAAERLYGYSATEAIGRDVLDVVTAGEDGGFANVLSRWRAGDRVELEDFPARRSNGEVVGVDVTVSPVRDAAGSIIGSASIARDVTEHKRLERVAEEDRRRLAEAQEVAQLGSFELDAATGAIYWSQSYRRLIGVDAHVPATIELFLSHVHPEDRERAAADVAEAWDRKKPSFSGTFRILRPSGEVRWLQFRTRALDDDRGNIHKVIGTAIDLTERHLTEAAGREAQERIRLGFERGAVPTAILDLAGIVTSANTAMCEFAGRSAEELVGQSATVFVHPEDRDDMAVRDRVFRGDRTPFERRFMRANGEIVWGLASLTLVRRDDHTPDYVYAQVQDITERRNAEKALEHMALHDPMTGLPNRLLLQDRLEQAIARASRLGQRMAVIFGDIDRFNLVNDTLGHSAGDQLLVELARRFESITAGADTVGRFGGDEFVMICEEVGPQESAQSIGRRMTAVFDRPFRVGEQDLYATVSCGVVLPAAKDTAATCFRDGDAAMYRAKELGRARTELFTKDMLQRATRLLDLESALRLAVEQGDLRVAYQPIIDLSSGRAIAVEALCRWKHPSWGEVSPVEFIPVAEQSGLIHKIGRFVIEEAIQQIGAWRDSLPGAEKLWVSVNISSAQLSADLVALCEQLIERDAEDGSFGFEITESVLLSDVEAAIAVLRRLRELGIPVAIDDFGTGYSSLEYLKRLPVHSIKIDQSFVAGLGRGHDPDDPSIVHAIIGLARALGLGSCAEGVETAEQRAALVALGCETAQGFLWARALAPDDFEAWYGDHLARLEQSNS